MDGISKFLAHPFTIAVAGALLSVVVIPLFTSRWQDHQRELDIKSKLVTDMTAIMAEPIANSRIWSRGASVGPEMPSYSETLRQIDIKQAEVSALLQVYFPKQFDLSRRWEAFARALNYCIRLTAADPPFRRDSHLEVVRAYVSSTGAPTQINWEALRSTGPDFGFGPDFEKAYEALTALMLRQGNSIVQQVIESKIQLASVSGRTGGRADDSLLGWSDALTTGSQRTQCRLRVDCT